MAVQSACASAPASIGNVGVGFDILGQAFDAARDIVTAVRVEEPGVRLGEVSGVVTSLPRDPASNTALAAAQAVLDASGAKVGISLSIRKGIPMAAGMGGSAASAVAAAAATNALLGAPLRLEQLLPCALEGERAATNPPPWDNVMASLFGGLVLAAREKPVLIERLAVPDGLTAILIHPAAAIETRSARSMLAQQVPMNVAVEHSRRVAAFVAGCATGNLEMIRAGLEDVLIEPQRRTLFPALPLIKAAAVAGGALGCSFSGSGPSIFAWVEDGRIGAVEQAMTWALKESGIEAKVYRAPIMSDGVRLHSAEEVLVRR